MKSNYIEGVFRSKWLSKFISKGSIKGNKFKLEKFLYFSFFELKKNFVLSPLFLFFEALEKLKPSVGLKIYTQGNSKKKRVKACPILLNFCSQYTKALYWMLKAIQLRTDLFFHVKIYNELENITLNESVNHMKMKKEYYNYAIIFKSAKRFNW